MRARFDWQSHLKDPPPRPADSIANRIYIACDVMPVAGTAPLRLGTRDKKSFFTGALDEVAIYPRALTAREIADNSRAGRAG